MNECKYYYKTEKGERLCSLGLERQDGHSVIRIDTNACVNCIFIEQLNQTSNHRPEENVNVRSAYSFGR